MDNEAKYIRWFEKIGNEDVPEVGGKNASLGEMIGALRDEGVKVPGGFATTAGAYWKFLDENNLKEKLTESLDGLDRGGSNLAKVGKAVRAMFRRAEMPAEIKGEITGAYRELCDRNGREDLDVAVRSSATAEDLPDASFAGQQETFLNISGEEELIEACKKCFASLFTDRAISYRMEKGFEHMKVALSVGVQKMVRSDKGGAGVMFTIDTETGFSDAVVINAAWGLGENVVQGAVNPDEYMVFKPLLEKKGLAPVIGLNVGEKEKKMVYARGGTNTTKNVATTREEKDSPVLSEEEILRLARWAVVIERHYGRPMDIEWAKDGESGELFIVQARPETVQSQREAGTLKSYRLKEKGKRIVEGLAIGEAVAAGTAQIIKDADDIDQFENGSVLITGMTDPDWVPIMKKAAGIVTDLGGRTSHAAIVSRELGIPAVVGTGDATREIEDGSEITLSCAEGETGYIYEGTLEYEEKDIDLTDIPETKTVIMMNIASPDAAFRWWRLPCAGVGLARMEFIINNIIKIHPMALVRFDDLDDNSVKRTIEKLTRRYGNKADYFIDHLARGISKIAAVHYPEPVIVRMSDFKTNEYANLIGGKQFEPREENPMLGFRGASRYYSDNYREGFALECRAIKKARETAGFTNILVMIPFCRTLEEADRVLNVLKKHDLTRGENSLQVYVMCEIPANVVLAEQFSERFDGFSIGTNDLTQLVLGVDRDSRQLSAIFDERNQAVKEMIVELIDKAHRKDRKVGICGQAPSDYPEFAEFLVRAGIDSLSLNPDSVIPVIRRVAEVERETASTRK